MRYITCTDKFRVSVRNVSGTDKFRVSVRYVTCTGRFRVSVGYLVCVNLDLLWGICTGRFRVKSLEVNFVFLWLTCTGKCRISIGCPAQRNWHLSALLIWLWHCINNKEQNMCVLRRLLGAAIGCTVPQCDKSEAEVWDANFVLYSCPTMKWSGHSVTPSVRHSVIISFPDFFGLCL